MANSSSSRPGEIGNADANADDVSQVVVLLDVNPYFWGGKLEAGPGSKGGPPNLNLIKWLQHAVMFMNSILSLNQLNQLVVIATGAQSCGFIFNSNDGNENGKSNSTISKQSSATLKIMEKLERFMSKDESISAEILRATSKGFTSLLSGSLSMALCYIQRSLRSTLARSHPRILCLQGTSDAPQQYVAIMNAIFSAQRSNVPIDTCFVGNQHSAFLQQAAHITGGVYWKPMHPEGLFEYLMTIFATDLFSRKFLQLPQSIGVDFRASCFCHKKTIDMGWVCSVCLSIFCQHQKTCATCGANFSHKSINALSGQKRKEPGA